MTTLGFPYFAWNEDDTQDADGNIIGAWRGRTCPTCHETIACDVNKLADQQHWFDHHAKESTS